MFEVQRLRLSWVPGGGGTSLPRYDFDRVMLRTPHEWLATSVQRWLHVYFETDDTYPPIVYQAVRVR